MPPRIFEMRSRVLERPCRFFKTFQETRRRYACSRVSWKFLSNRRRAVRRGGFSPSCF